MREGTPFDLEAVTRIGVMVEMGLIGLKDALERMEEARHRFEVELLPG